MLTTNGTWRRSLVIAGVIACVMAVSLIAARVRRAEELGVYVTAADRMTNGEEIYRPTDRKAFTYPPFFAIPFVPLAQLPASWQIPVWWAINLSLAGAAGWLVFLLTRAVREKSGQGRSALWWSTAITGLLSAKFMLLPLVHGSHDLLILVVMLMSGLALARGQQFTAGIGGGIAAACKATPLLLLPFFIWQRKLRAAAALIAALFVATLLPDLLFPHPSHKLWVEGWYSNFVGKVNVGSAPAASGAWKEWNELNQSLAGTVHRLTSVAPSNRAHLNVAIVSLEKNRAKLVTLGLDCLVLVFLAWLGWPRKLPAASHDDNHFHSLGYIGATLCGMLLLSPMSSTYHFCGLMPAIAFLVTYWMYCERNRVVAAALGIQLLISLLGGDLFGRLADLALAGGLYTFDAAMLLVACGYVLAHRIPKSAAIVPRQPISIAPQSAVGVPATRRQPSSVSTKAA